VIQVPQDSDDKGFQYLRIYLDYIKSKLPNAYFTPLAMKNKRNNIVYFYVYMTQSRERCRYMQNVFFAARNVEIWQGSPYLIYSDSVAVSQINGLGLPLLPQSGSEEMKILMIKMQGKVEKLVKNVILTDPAVLSALKTHIDGLEDYFDNPEFLDLVEYIMLAYTDFWWEFILLVKVLVVELAKKEIPTLLQLLR